MISEAKVKELLGLTDYTKDAYITALLPIVIADVKRIMAHQYREMVLTPIISGATTFYDPRLSMDHPFDIGRVVFGTGVPADTYVTDYDDVLCQVTVNNAFTASSDRIYTSVTIAQWMAIARMVSWRIDKLTGVQADVMVAGKSMGPVSITYDTSKMNKAYGYPQIILDDLGTPYQRSF
jgi:hypothetical protein